MTQSAHTYSRVVVSAKKARGLLGSNIQTVSVLVVCGNEQRHDHVTPSPRLTDLRQGLRMPGRTEWKTCGYPADQPDFTSLAGTPRGRPDVIMVLW